MNYEKDIELISAYIDGELSAEEIKIIEEKISLSPELKKRLAELKKIKELTASSVKKINESPYFETKLYSYLEDKPRKDKFKKWIPAVGFAALTVFIMMILKFNPNMIENIFEEQKVNLAGFYKENLKPLLFASDLSNEDIFNFAFFNQLPLDNTKTQFIHLGSDIAGDEYFEINTAGSSVGEENFENFVETLSLNTEEKYRFDSIMSSYAHALQSQILVNDKNTVAISPNLWNYRKAIVADILAFAKETGKGIADQMPVLFKVETPVVEKVVHKVKANKDNEYIFFTPDSLFIDTFVFDEEEFSKEMELSKYEMKRSIHEMKKQQKELKELNNVNLKLDSSLIKLRRAPRVDKNISVFIDSNVCRVHIDKIEIPDIEFPDMDSLEALINEATKQMEAFTFRFNVPKPGKDIHRFNFEYEDSVESFEFNVPVPNVDSILKKELENLDIPNTPMFPFLSDSSVQWFKFFKNNDSTLTGNQHQFELRMKEFEEEMKKFKEEMEELKIEIRKDSVKVIKKKGVEI